MQAFRDYVKEYSKKRGVEVFLHLDHCRDTKVLGKAVDAGWDSVMYDGSLESIDDNICHTKLACDYAHERGCLVEAEVGCINGVEEESVITNGEVADLDEVKRLLDNTDVDMIAAAFGNAHGLYKGKPVLEYKVIEEIGKVYYVPFVVHGGSGMGNEVLKKLLSFPNVKKINISTDVKLAYLRGIKEAEKKNLLKEKGFDAVSVESCISESIGEVVAERMSILD